ncbi:MAG: GGDEF domain-containing protein [Deltaproteobacteria bacterium]|nr:GGDEF domain-containing protein [Deltaproteobacteria bacterium]
MLVPLAYFVVRAIERGAAPTFDWLTTEFSSAPVSYLFLVLATTAVLGATGFWLGRKEESLRALAITDCLTGLSNRRYFDERAADELRRAKRYSTPIAVAVFDVDHLKRINDVHGHRAGDDALRSVAAAIGNNVRASDVAARLGGDEFVVLCPHTTSDDARILAERIRVDVDLASGPDPSQRVTISGGLADLLTARAHAVNEVTAAADAALYEAKARGRNRTVVFDERESERAFLDRGVLRLEQEEEKNGYARHRDAPAHRGGCA